METIIQGKAYVLGKNIDTDQIIPAEHLVYSLSDPEEVKLYGKYALSGVPPEQGGLPEGNTPFVSEGTCHSDYSIIIAGPNFGCGSSREHAPFALQVAGAKAIVAESYARIFYRNCVDGGFVIPYETRQQLNQIIKTGDELKIDVEANTLTNVTENVTWQLNPLGDVINIVKAGGIFAYARQENLMANE
ncbi:LeuD/DmdB family oxidoreductase small subunit [Chlorobium phaeobacteroides]|jgi:3-isopropylmalate/(R)-2-methylmalate dehydratase small subunit|uniref:3-isopropylmalate dehydratase n=1 Tax=Chlorobium phaeobacteroides (strain DSM 266 / SMG 266 / 2430) TaxID=290317 RepID=A1BES1_CHLPD|nr:3-isopropylmalate dehydratase small subunit [Chlorobium phaeobacteroides]ABL64898.1 3-isopropylmalate dehydratase, small subunit [Chlorobium phaeobacteroides DSM 266]MBV5328614.1 3-isopropylmalate dehydratase [Chlorobium sp.]